MRALAIMVVLGAGLSSGPALAGGLAGEWSYQALNSGDSNFRAEQQGDEISFYRVMHPEFEGERYLLEHIYRGRLQGDAISGKLLVREDGRGQFEPLRDFTGRVLGPERIELDDMPLRRLGSERVDAVAVAASTPPATETPDRPNGNKTYRRVVIKRPEKPLASPREGPAAKTAEPGRPAGNGAAPLVIPELVRVSRRLAGRRAEAQRLMARGDELFAGKEYAAAAEHYRRALAADPAKVEVLYKLGWSHGSLGVLAERAGDRAGAAAHYRRAVRFWRRALRYDPYNRGARENIRRALEKLTRLEGK